MCRSMQLQQAIFTPWYITRFSEGQGYPLLTREPQCCFVHLRRIYQWGSSQNWTDEPHIIARIICGFSTRRSDGNVACENITTYLFDLVSKDPQDTFVWIRTFGEEHTTIPTFGSYFFDVVPQKFWNQISDIVRLLCHHRKLTQPKVSPVRG